MNLLPPRFLKLQLIIAGKWKESKECEALMERYVALLRRSTAKPGQVRRNVMRGLRNYPHNSVLLEMLVQSSSATWNLRRYFDESVKRWTEKMLVRECVAWICKLFFSCQVLILFKNYLIVSYVSIPFSCRNPSTLLWMFALATELGSNNGNAARIQCLFERALEMKATQHSVLLWRTYLAYECNIHRNIDNARRIYFRAIHACPWYIFPYFLRCI